MKKYLVSIRIEGCAHHIQRLFEAENAAGAICKANGLIKEKGWNATVTAVYERLWHINPFA